MISNYIPGSNTLKFDDVVGVILSEDMKRKTTGKTSGNVLTMESKGRQRERGRSPGNHNKSRKVIYKSILGKIECWNGGKRGHIKKYCRAPKKKVEKQQETTLEENVARDEL